MPALVSHHRFASAALKQAQPYLADAAAAAPMAFHWGAQGPDILFYYQPYHANHVVQMGHRLHHEHVARTFNFMTSACANWNTPAATAYLLGYCCHYVLDRAVHPFVTYMANYRLDPLFPRLSHSALHNMCEAELDRKLIETYYPSDGTEFRSYLLLSDDPKTADAAASLLSDAAWHVYGARVTPKSVHVSMHSMIRIQRLLHDKSGRRAATIGWVENCLGMSGSISSLMRSAKPLGADCVNTSHRVWIDAADPHTRLYTDFFQILEQAQCPAAELMAACYDAIQTRKPLSPMLFSLNYLGLPE